jgi:hypothetical protein
MYYRPPPGRRLIVDWSGGRRVVESTLDGEHVLAPYDDVVIKPAIGEADISAQYYAIRGQTREKTHDRSVVSRDVVPLPATHAPYYRPEMTDASADDRVVTRTTHYVIDTEAACRREFEAGDVVLQSTDTDFVSLALAVEASHVSDDTDEYALHVVLGTAHVHAETGEYCTSTTPRALLRREIYNIRALAGAVRQLHGNRVDDNDDRALWSFVAFCIACGNDYTRRLPRFSHASFFEAYRYIVERGVALVRADSPPLVDARAFIRFVRAAYYIRLPERRRPTSWTPDDELPTYSELAAVVRSSASPMPSADALTRYFEQICWSLMYATHAVQGVEHVPEPMEFTSETTDDNA